MLSHIPFPVLPVPRSWYPGHMMKFTKILPALLSRTDVVLELRDSRLPLTSINGNLEGALQRWRDERVWASRPASLDSTVSQTAQSSTQGAVAERIVVFNKNDLVPEWGMEPFRKAMSNKFPDQHFLFASWNRPRDVKKLSNLLVSIAKRHPYATELNVLVIGMPNVGKSTLLNALRNIGIPGPTPKALRTSALPGLTRTLSTRLKLSEEPKVYAYDSPGVMLPFLGNAEQGAERGVKLALIAGIKEGMYDVEALVAYLMYRLNVLNPIDPAYLRLLPPPSEPTTDTYEFLDRLAKRLGMLKRGGERDLSRAATWFIKWWREEGGQIAASSAPDTSSLLSAASAPRPSSSTPATNSTDTPTIRSGWGFDLEWSVQPGEEVDVERKMEECIDEYMRRSEEQEREGANLSVTQVRKRSLQEVLEKRAAKSKMKAKAKLN